MQSSRRSSRPNKAKAREKARADAESWFSGRPARWDLLEASANALREGEYGIPPFHWAVEFPEVFTRENGGFDAIVGNPPFLGGAKIWPTFGGPYATGLKFMHSKYLGGKGRTWLPTFFVDQLSTYYGMVGLFGLIATNTDCTR